MSTTKHSVFDQFDGSTGYVKPTLESLPPNNFSYGDLNVGLNYTATIGRSAKVFTGLAYHHVNQPNVSFFESNGKGGKLYPKYSGQFAANIPLRKDNRVSLLPRFLVASQGPHMEINTGTNFRVAMGKYGASAIHFGTWVRPVRNDGGFGMDAVVALLGLELNSVLFGLSYDLSLKGLAANQRQGAFELTIAYLGSYENEEIICPKF
jgi:type IX secretion system PorP/SprF family membrane protein